MFIGGFNLVLIVQGTVVEGTIQQLFEGHHMNYIECINVEYKSTRKESFYGINSWCKFELSGVEKSLFIALYQNIYVIVQTSNLMSKAAGMFMILLISMWKSNVLRVITNTMLKNMVCRLVTVGHLHTNIFSLPLLSFDKAHLEVLLGRLCNASKTCFVLAL